eukprot:Opistho-2@70366
MGDEEALRAQFRAMEEQRQRKLSKRLRKDGKGKTSSAALLSGSGASLSGLSPKQRRAEIDDFFQSAAEAEAKLMEAGDYGDDDMGLELDYAIDDSFASRQHSAHTKKARHSQSPEPKQARRPQHPQSTSSTAALAASHAASASAANGINGAAHSHTVSFGGGMQSRGAASTSGAGLHGNVKDSRSFDWGGFSQMREVESENAALLKQLAEKDKQLRRLLQTTALQNSNVAGMALDPDKPAEAKILELAKKNRDLTAALEAERTRAKAMSVKVVDMEKAAAFADTGARRPTQQGASEHGKGGGGVDTGERQQRPVADLEERLRTMKDELAKAQGKSREYREKLEGAKRELKVAHRVLVDEIGDDAVVQRALAGASTEGMGTTGAGGYRGRAQQIIALKDKLSLAQQRIGACMCGVAGGGAHSTAAVNLNASANRSTAGGFGDADVSTAPVAGGVTPAAVASTGRFVEQQKEQLRKVERERKEALERAARECDQLRSELAETRTKYDAVSARCRTLQGEAKESREKIKVLLEKAANDDELIEQMRSAISTQKGRGAANKRIDDEDAKNAVRAEMEIDSLSKALRDAEQQIRRRDDTILRLKQEVQSASVAAQQARAVAVTAGAGASSVTGVSRPESGRSGSRVGSAGSRASLLTQHVGDGVGSVRVPSAAIDSAELKGSLRASQVECERLNELLQLLKARLTDAEKKLADAEGTARVHRHRAAQLEKQLAQSQLGASGASSGGGKSRGPGASVAGDRRQTEMESRLALQEDEITALKSSLHATINSKEEELSMYHRMLSQTRAAFASAMDELRAGVS